MMKPIKIFINKQLRFCLQHATYQGVIMICVEKVIVSTCGLDKKQLQANISN